ncbi:MAG: type II secretion system protein M [Candidatus Saganbacteria bacterium]|nr:type II secretion system protein M [Candidatus Saganbacteria bacterium]
MAEAKKQSSAEREKLLMVGAGGAVIIYVFYTFLLSPVLEDVGRAGQEVKAKRQELTLAEGQVRILGAFTAPHAPEKVEVPPSEKSLVALKLISLATNRSGLKIDYIKPLAEESGESLKFNLSCSGSYKQLYTFLEIINGLQVVIVIDTLDISSGGGRQPVLGIKVNLTAHY